MMGGMGRSIPRVKVRRSVESSRKQCALGAVDYRPSKRVDAPSWMAGQSSADCRLQSNACNGHRSSFSVFHGKVLGEPEFPLPEVRLQQMIRHIEKGDWTAQPSYVFNTENIREAHKLLEAGKANGKIVVQLLSQVKQIRRSSFQHDNTKQQTAKIKT